MKVINEFSSTQLDSHDEENGETMAETKMQITSEFSEYMARHKVLKIKNKFTPKGLVPLEQVFDKNDVPIKPTVLPQYANPEECNIGTKRDPKSIKLSKEASP
jgi:hypothetical protein